MELYFGHFGILWFLAYVASEGLSPELLTFYRIENQKIFAQNSGEGTTYTPIEGLTSVGANVKMFSGQ
jgi:hypothetical protein